VGFRRYAVGFRFAVGFRCAGEFRRYAVGVTVTMA
jgi:hypothetical protein